MEIAEGEFQRFKPSPLYRCTLVVVSLLMILPPLLYFGLVGLIGWSVVYYAVHANSLIGILSPIMALLFYFGPIFAGGLLVFFLIKPLFAPRWEKERSLSLNHADAPELFALIGSICRALNAPIPSRVDVDCNVNAVVQFRGGWRSLFGNDLMLCIGLPLVAGMSRGQFAGILAHEYGHFSQGTAMRAQYIIGHINQWFARVVYQRDLWDLYLIAATEAENPGIFGLFIFWLARAGIALGRGVLWLFMIFGRLLSSFMWRQMEFDADQYEIKMAGSETFISTTLRLQQLNLGGETAWKILQTKWKKEKKLFDRIPDFIAGRANEISAEAQERHYARAFRRKTGVFDSHPSDAARISRARTAAEPGLYHDLAPAKGLFTDFPELSRRVTLFYYQNLIGPKFQPECLISLEQAAARAEHDYAADREIVKRLLLGVVAEARPLLIQESKSLTVRRQETLAPEWRAAKQRMEELQPAAELALAEFIAAETRLMQATQAAQLLQAGLQFDPAEFGLPDNEIEPALEEARAIVSAADAGLQAFEDAVRTRLNDACQLLRAPQFAPLIPDAQKRHDEAREMLWVLSRLAEAIPPLLELRKDSATLEILLAYRREQPAADNTTAVLETVATGIQEKINQLQALTAQIRYPFHHTTEQVLVNEYARNKEYHADPFELALREARSHVQKLLDLHARVLARLIVLCEEVEACLKAK